MTVKVLSRTALLLALMLLFQSLRLYLPMPVFISAYIVGSLVNACLLLATAALGPKPASALAVVAPVIAYLQQALPLPFLILPVATANLAYIGGYLLTSSRGSWPAITAAATAKFIILYLTVTILIEYLGVTGRPAAVLTLLLGWPQWITGLGGGVIFFAVHRRLFRLISN